MEKIFLVNTVKLVNIGKFSADRFRCWGWFSTFEEAEQCIMENWGDLYEGGYYDMALIEEMGPGIAVTGKEYWYSTEFDEKNDTYNINKIEKPKGLKNIVCFSWR